MEQSINCLLIILCSIIARKKHTNLSMVWIDYEKVYDVVPDSWICYCMELFGIADNVKNSLKMSMEQWKLLLTSNGKDL